MFHTLGNFTDRYSFIFSTNYITRLHTCLFSSHIYFLGTLGSGQGGLKDNIILDTEVGYLHSLPFYVGLR